MCWRSKENQGRLYQDVTGFFQHAERIGFGKIESDYHRTVSKEHGRIEVRQCWTISDPEYLSTLADVEGSFQTEKHSEGDSGTPRW